MLATGILTFLRLLSAGLGGATMVMGTVDFGGVGDILGAMPNGTNLRDGMKMTFSVGSILLWIGLFITFTHAFIEEGWRWLLVVWDLILAAILIGGIILQASFLPHSYADCGNAITTQNTTDGSNINFYVHANLTGFMDTTEGAERVCHVLVEQWLIALSFTAVMSTVALCYLLQSMIRQAGYTKVSEKVFSETFELIGNAWKILYAAPGWIWGGIKATVKWIARSAVLTADLVVASGRLSVRYCAKVTLRLRQFVQLRASERRWNKKAGTAVSRRAKQGDEEQGGDPGLEITPREEKKQGGKTETTAAVPMQELLWAPDATSHYADVVRRNPLALQKARAGEVEAKELAGLRATTCGGSESQCSICKIQICEGCTYNVSLPVPATVQHLTKCQPYCTSHFFQDYCRRGGAHSLRRAEHTAECSVIVEAKEATADPTLSTNIGPVCRLCADMDIFQRRDMIEARYRAEITLAAGGEVKCAKEGCDREPKGVLWWVCSDCGTECPDHLHPAWYRGAEPKVLVEKVWGVEAAPPEGLEDEAEEE